MQFDVSFLLSFLAILISLLSAMYTSIQAREARNVRKVTQIEAAESVIEMLEASINKIRTCDNPVELNDFVGKFVNSLKKRKSLLGINCYRKFSDIIDPMWEAEQEKSNFLKHGIGKQLSPDGFIPPTHKLNELEVKVPLLIHRVRDRLTMSE